MSSNLDWKIKSTEKLFDLPILSVLKNHSLGPDGKTEGDYFVLDCRDWVVVIPETEKTFLMVKQWRHGINRVSVEFPGGIIDKGESPSEAAKRELLEETGCEAGNIIHLGSMSPNPAIQNNSVHIFLAKDLKMTGKQHLDSDEFVEYLEIDKKEVIKNMGNEEYCHGIMAAALCLYLSGKTE